MGHKITKEEAIQKYESEMENRKLIEQGIQIKSKRAERKRATRIKKKATFLEMLKNRGGLFKPKPKKVKKNEMDKEASNI